MKDLCVFDIQRFALHDGPGIRTTIFTKGCPLDCQWCHNPESKSSKPQLRCLFKQCVGCGRCQEVCPTGAHHVWQNGHTIEFEKCIQCGACVDVCYYDVLKIYGVSKTTDEILKVVMRDRSFYENSGGGMTVSGGEPMAQFEPVLDLFKAAKERNLHTCLDTCGFAPTANYKKILPFVDIFLYDYKLTKEDKHVRYTGVKNGLIKENLNFLCSHGATVFLRCPIIPGINNDEEHFRAIATLSQKYENIKQVNIMAYHDMTKGKVEQIGEKYKLEEIKSVNNAEKKVLYTHLSQLGCLRLKES